MNIGVVGLGLIGGSVAKSIKQTTPHTVLGYDIDDNVVRMAKLIEAIDLPLDEARIGICDMLILALYPRDIVRWVTDNAEKIAKGAVVNLGVGMPADVAKVMNEEGVLVDFVMSTESGMVGGIPCALPSFGSAFNPQAIITPPEMFDFISGGGLDVTCLGIGEIDADGNNNVSRMGKRFTGPGGFIDITRATKKVIFAGTFTGKAKLQIGEGKLTIVEEGPIKKFLNKVTQITFAAQYAPDEQEVFYITERAVFQLIDHRITLIEIAPGIDLEKDILSQMDFVPAISDDLKQMDERMFCETWGGLKNA